MTTEYITHKRLDDSIKKITHVKVDGMIYPIQDIIELIEKNKQNIMVKDNVGRKHTVWVKTKSGKKFLTTNPDGTKINLIDTLPSFQIYQSNTDSNTNHKPVKRTIVIGSVFAVIAIILISMYLIQDTTMISQDAQNEILAIKMVKSAIDTYDLDGTLSFIEFDGMNEFHNNDSQLYVFVIEKESHVIRAHGVNPLLIGTSSMDSIDPDGINIGKLIDDNVTSDGVWVEYKFLNPETEQIEPKTSWIILHDGYIFGAGIYHQ